MNSLANTKRADIAFEALVAMFNIVIETEATGPGVGPRAEFAFMRFKEVLNRTSVELDKTFK